VGGGGDDRGENEVGKIINISWAKRWGNKFKNKKYAFV
jgi:hypothetical protein